VGEAVLPHAVTPTVARTANVFAKGALVLLLVLALLFPDQGNLRDQAAGMRAVGYPLISFLLPTPSPGRAGAACCTSHTPGLGSFQFLRQTGCRGADKRSDPCV